MAGRVSSSVSSTCFSAFATSVSLFFSWANEFNCSVNSATVIFFADQAGNTHPNTIKQTSKRFIIPLLIDSENARRRQQCCRRARVVALLSQLEILVFGRQHGPACGVLPR